MVCKYGSNHWLQKRASTVWLYPAVSESLSLPPPPPLSLSLSLSLSLARILPFLKLLSFSLTLSPHPHSPYLPTPIPPNYTMKAAKWKSSSTTFCVLYSRSLSDVSPTPIGFLSSHRLTCAILSNQTTSLLFSDKDTVLVFVGEEKGRSLIWWNGSDRSKFSMFHSSLFSFCRSRCVSPFISLFHTLRHPAWNQTYIMSDATVFWKVITQFDNVIPGLCALQHQTATSQPVQETICSGLRKSTLVVKLTNVLYSTLFAVHLRLRPQQQDKPRTERPSTSGITYWQVEPVDNSMSGT